MLLWRRSSIRAVKEADGHARYSAYAGPVVRLSVDDGILLVSERCGLTDPGHNLFNRLRPHRGCDARPTERSGRRQKLDLKEQLGRRVDSPLARVPRLWSRRHRRRIGVPATLRSKHRAQHSLSPLEPRILSDKSADDLPETRFELEQPPRGDAGSVRSSARHSQRSPGHRATGLIDILDRDLRFRRYHQVTFGRRNPIAAQAASSLIMKRGGCVS
jgi:hypothetical protein